MYMVSFTEYMTEFQQAPHRVLPLPNITPHMLATVQILDSQVFTDQPPRWQFPKAKLIYL